MSNERQISKSGGLGARTLTAAIMAPSVLAILLFAPVWAWFALVWIIVTIGLREYFAMTMSSDETAVGAVGLAMGVLLFPVMYCLTPTGAEVELHLFCVFVTIILVTFLAVLFSNNAMERAAYLVGTSLGGLLYVSFLLSFIVLLRRDAGDMGRYWVILLLVMVWAGDSGAYFVGRWLGKHKLAPQVSPNKTWEGAIGGLIFSLILAFSVNALTPLNIPPLALLCLVIPASILGQLGDLCESQLKRSTGVKDSGRIIYGHGGVLDRVDSIIFAAPFFYLFYRFTEGTLS
jgi:phosphatidate cytidylyltransferase